MVNHARHTAWPDEVRERAVALYLSGHSSNAVAKKVGVSAPTIGRWVAESGNAVRSRSEALKKAISYGGMRMPRAKGAAHYNWKGGRFVGVSGYAHVLMPEHPRARMNGYVREHIVVMERKIGRPIRDDEIVHHENGVKTDNRPENLSVMSRADHASHHHTGRRRGR